MKGLRRYRDIPKELNNGAFMNSLEKEFKQLLEIKPKTKTVEPDVRNRVQVVNSNEVNHREYQGNYTT